MKEIKEYQACYYKNDGCFMNGEMSNFKSFDTPEECNKYIDELIAKKKAGFIQLLLKSNETYAEDFAIGDEPIYFVKRRVHINYYTQLRQQYSGVPALPLLVANLVQDILINSNVVQLNEEQYEEVCDYVYDYVVHSEMAVDSLVNFIHDAVIQGLPIIDLIINGSWEDADEIIYARM